MSLCKKRYFCFGAQKQNVIYRILSYPYVLAMKFHYLTTTMHLGFTKSQPCAKQICPPSMHLCNIKVTFSTTTYTELQQTVRLTSFQKPPLQSVSIFFTFVLFKVPFYPPFNVLSGYFYVSLNLVAVPETMINFGKQLLFNILNSLVLIASRLWKWTFWFCYFIP